MLDGRADLEIERKEKRSLTTEFNGNRVVWEDSKAGIMPIEVNGQAVKAKIWHIDTRGIVPNRGLLTRLSPVGRENARDVLKKNAWGDVLLCMTDRLAGQYYYSSLRQIRDEYSLEGESLEKAERPEFDDIWKEAFADMVNLWQEFAKGKRLRVVELDASRGLVTGFTVVKTYEIIDEAIAEDDPRAFEAAIIGIQAVRTARQISGNSAEMRTEIVILPETAELDEARGLRIKGSDLGHGSLFRLGGFCDKKLKLPIIFPGSTTFITRSSNRLNLSAYQESLKEVIYHEFGHKFHGFYHHCPSRIVQEGVAQVCQFIGLQSDDYEIHGRVEGKQIVDIGRMARIIEKEFKAEYNEWGLCGDGEVDNLTTREIYSLSGSLFWMIYCLEKPGKDRVIKFAQFVRLISGYDGLDRNGEYTRLSPADERRKKEITKYGVTFIGGNLAQVVQKVYGKDLAELGRLWQETV